MALGRNQILPGARCSTWRHEGLCFRKPLMAASVHRPSLIVADRWRDYQLLDCGNGMKQERWGPYILVRPDPQVLWPGAAEIGEWDGFYHRRDQGGGRWEFRRELPEHWEIG